MIANCELIREALCNTSFNKSRLFEVEAELQHELLSEAIVNFY